jgi:hypothetical protein
MSDLSILANVGDVIDEWLKLKNGRFKHTHKKSCQLLSEGPVPGLDGTVLIKKMLDRIQSNWHKGKSRSDKQNWRCKQNPDISDKNKSREIYLERLIIKTQVGADWFNQVPVSSGLTSEGGGRRAIDLVHRCQNEWYDFIELKADHRGGTPLFAAMEILQYGVLYIFSREKTQELGYDGIDLLKAKGIHLRVLAPADYYETYNLSWLENCIDRGLTRFLRKFNFKMDFKFETLSLTPTRSSPLWVPGGPKRTSP